MPRKTYPAYNYANQRFNVNTKVKGLGQAWLGYLLVGLLAIGGFFLLPSQSAQNVYYDLIGFSAVAAIAGGVHMHRPAPSLPWYVFAFGLLVLVAGEVIWTYYESVLGIEAPYPSAADVFYLSALPCIAAGLVLVAHRRVPERPWVGMIDALIIATVAGMFSWIFLISPNIGDQARPLLDRVVSIAYPVMDLVLLVAMLGLVFASKSRLPAHYLLCASLAFLLIADTVYAAMQLADTYETGNPIDAGWMLSYVLFGAAALNPSMVDLSEPIPNTETKLTWQRLALLAGTLLIAPVVLTYQAVFRGEVDVTVIAGGSVVLLLLVTLHVVGMIKERERIEDELRHSEEKYRSVIHSIKEVIFQTDDTGIWTFLNPAWAEITGFSVEESVGKNVLDYVHPEDRQLTQRLFGSLVEREKDYCRNGSRYVTKGGDYRWIEIWARPTLDETGNPVGISGTLTDVTERKNVEEELREVNRRLSELAVLKADFTAMVAHELGSPLAAIRKLTEMLRTEEADREDNAYAMDAIGAELDTLEGLVADVQASAGVERDDFGVEFRPVLLSALLADAELFSRTLPDHHSVDFILDPDLGTGEKVLADPERIGQVLRNLLSNAAKYSPEGVPIKLHAKRRQDYIRIEVVDHGPGIHPEDVVRIFEKFGRGRDRERKKIKGMGLGLYLSRRIVQAHGGDITVNSTPDEGAIFGFELEMASKEER
jgi:PAS domain S-box-containing protein